MNIQNVKLGRQIKFVSKYNNHFIAYVIGKYKFTSSLSDFVFAVKDKPFKVENTLFYLRGQHTLNTDIHYIDNQAIFKYGIYQGYIKSFENI